MEHVVEKIYPITFRKRDCEVLGEHIKNRHSLVLVGMKRVGISQFLRFFLNHNDIVSTYINDGKRHLFISVDLNDLVEREIFPFWTLLLKRIVDAVQSSDISDEVKKEVEDVFNNSIQLKDLFFTLESIRKSLRKIIDEDYVPTIFLNRFDRIKDAANPEFFDNLHGLKEASHQKLAFVLTSYRSLDVLAPSVFQKTALSVFAHTYYIKPAVPADMKAVLQTNKRTYELAISPALEESILELVGGHMQYLQYAFILIHERKDAITTKDDLFNALVGDERVGLQSDELWESLDSKEQETVLKVCNQDGEVQPERNNYLWDSGFLFESDSQKVQLFNPIIDYHIEQKIEKKPQEPLVEFTKKEHMLFDYLQKHANEICERETIIEAVWPEVTTLGVSDWAVDRLVARVRQKLKAKNNPFEIQTIKTRGYKLIPLS